MPPAIHRLISDRKSRKQDMGIHLIITGGTIDSYYDGSKDTVIPHKKSVIPAYLERAHIYGIRKITEICMKDSRAVNMDDRRRMLHAIERSRCRKIIITHGTYTMPDTAKYLKANMKCGDKTILFTGAFVPLTGFSESDASFNLGYAFANVNYLPHGMYVCMNGKIFSPDEIVKLIDAGKFTSIFEK